MNSFATSISIALQYGVPLETLVQKFSYMRFDPEGITQNPEIPFAKSMPDYIMRWLASRFLDADTQEELGILTQEVRARKAAEAAASSIGADTAGPKNGNGGNGGHAHGGSTPGASAGGASGSAGGASVDAVGAGDASAPEVDGPAGTSPSAGGGDPQPPTVAFTDTPPVIPARLAGLDLGPACSQCGGMMQRTGSCYTCSSCGNNTGCG
jgi:ribonucleoside-diphosphate reductase alpha chain